MIDLGTGDGLFVYQSARENPKRLFIGIDANPRQLEKISEKIHRKPELPNALYLQAAVEDLPEELDGVADEVHVHFPWGSLLRAVTTGEHLDDIVRLCAPDALVEVIIGLDPDRDRTELDRLGIGPLSLRDLERVYAAAGLEVIESGALSPAEWAGLQTSWAKRLRSGGSNRTVVFVIARRRRRAPSSD